MRSANAGRDALVTCGLPPWPSASPRPPLSDLGASKTRLPLALPPLAAAVLLSAPTSRSEGHEEQLLLCSSCKVAASDCIGEGQLRSIE